MMNPTELEAAIRHALDDLFPGRIELMKFEPTASGKIGGFVVSPAFEGMPHMNRQDLVWEHLTRMLGPEIMRQIVSILTMTPDEVFDD
jgi:stress-induced morphogen